MHASKQEWILVGSSVGHIMKTTADGVAAMQTHSLLSSIWRKLATHKICMIGSCIQVKFEPKLFLMFVCLDGFAKSQHYNKMMPPLTNNKRTI